MGTTRDEQSPTYRVLLLGMLGSNKDILGHLESGTYIP